MNLKGKDFLSLGDFSSGELNHLILTAEKLKNEKNKGIEHKILKGKTLAMIFEKPSLRTRVSFEVGINQLGGNAVVIKGDEISLGKREPICDVARTLERYVDAVMIRTFAHENLTEFAKYAKVPVINALSDSSHPCQILADLLTIKETFGKLKGLKLAYIGDGNNVANSLLLGCSLVGMYFSIGCPKGYEPDGNYLKKAEEISNKTGSKISVLNNPQEAAKDADILYTDVWVSMGQEEDREEKLKIFKGYQINEKLMPLAKKNAIVLHCLPAHRGEEITAEVFEKYADVIFQQAENRLHAQKAVMAEVMA